MSLLTFCDAVFFRSAKLLTMALVASDTMATDIKELPKNLIESNVCRNDNWPNKWPTIALIT